MKFENIKAGDTLYDVHSYRMGNTTIRTMGCWPVRILSVDDRGAQVVWNGNVGRPQYYSRRTLEKLRAKKPEFETSVSGRETIKKRAKKEPTP